MPDENTRVNSIEGRARCSVVAAVVALALPLVMCGSLQAQGGRAGAAATAPPPTPRAASPIDLAGYWVAIISEDWRWRMVTPAQGDYARIPLTVEGKRGADTLDPA